MDKSHLHKHQTRKLESSRPRTHNVDELAPTNGKVQDVPTLSHVHHFDTSCLAHRLVECCPRNHSPPSDPLAVPRRLGLEVEPEAREEVASQVRLDTVRRDNHVRLGERWWVRRKIESHAGGVGSVGCATTVKVGDARRDKSDELVQEVGAAAPLSVRSHTRAFMRRIYRWTLTVTAAESPGTGRLCTYRTD